MNAVALKPDALHTARNLRALLRGLVSDAQLKQIPDLSVSGLSLDSRAQFPGSIFIAVPWLGQAWTGFCPRPRHFAGQLPAFKALAGPHGWFVVGRRAAVVGFGPCIGW